MDFYIKFFNMESKQQFDDLAIAVLHDYLVSHEAASSDFKYRGSLNVANGVPTLTFSVNDEIVETIGMYPSSEVIGPNQSALIDINQMAETMFREETVYGLKDPNKLDAIIHACMDGAFGQEYYPGVVNKAAAFWFKIADSQCFHNGNKRTALLAGLFVLSVNGLEMAGVSGNEMYEVSSRIARKELNQSEVAEFIRNHLVIKRYSSLEEAKNFDVHFKIRFTIDKNES